MNSTIMFRMGFILSGRGDLFWFLGLPFIAVGAALAGQQWLPAVAVASVALWITIPHHFATWFRTYGFTEERRRWRDRLIVGPLVIGLATLAGLRWAPITLVLVATLWDHQHSVMQQYGFTRIYDFKARTGSPSTPRFDYLLNWVLYVNLFITAPLFSQFWVREIYRLGLPISAETIRNVHSVSWACTVLFAIAYLCHIAVCIRRGYAINPVKYVFLGASYFLWYFVSWQTASFLVYGIAHRMMHGLQYIVIVRTYIRRKEQHREAKGGLLARLVEPKHLGAFVVMCLVYATIYQLMTNQPLREFGLGIVGIGAKYHAIPQLGLAGITPVMTYDLFATMLIHTAAMTHYYFDSFIWKVRDPSIQEGL